MRQRQRNRHFLQFPFDSFHSTSKLFVSQADNFEFTPLGFVKLVGLFQLTDQAGSFFRLNLEGSNVLLHPLDADAKLVEKVIRFPTFFDTGSQSVNLSNLDLRFV